MDFSNQEKLLLKVNQTYLLSRPNRESPFSLNHLRWMRDLNGARAKPLEFLCTPLASKNRKEFVIEDISEDGLVLFKAPPVGYFNDYTRGCSGVLVRPPFRSFKIGFREDNCKVFFRSSLGSENGSLVEINEDSYSNLLKNNYPSFGDAALMLKGDRGFPSISLSRTTALIKDKFSVFSLEIAGTKVAWFWNGKTTLVGKASKDLLELATGFSLDKLAEEVAYAQ